MKYYIILCLCTQLGDNKNIQVKLLMLIADHSFIYLLLQIERTVAHFFYV